MKVIDLLNKIANKEEVPKVIEYNDIQFKFNEVAKDYIEVNGALRHLFTYYLEGLTGNLNDEVYEIELIEEYKPIEELHYTGDGHADYTSVIPKINELVQTVNKLNKEMNK